ncbi:hypothetical protein OGAPHI_005836 [Ogataea philodendri]|uniref:Uncharacterized protein n=1 Tax=Ogataea philodendri TaxID=1378263 RepID=A0A9P8T1X1_9ASCO|nr:uncharacterized protein OGAPHI_005836 [Ogataea philodendri]KAH3662584.1 hypothetical protein OGAPHI_005836 [Ogataea philodendri]
MEEAQPLTTLNSAGRDESPAAATSKVPVSALAQSTRPVDSLTSNNQIHADVVEVGRNDVIQSNGHTGGRSTVVIPHVQVVFLVSPRWRACWRVAEQSVVLEGVGGVELELSSVTRSLFCWGHHDHIMARGLEVSVQSSDVGGCPSIVVGEQNVFGGGSNNSGCKSEKSLGLHWILYWLSVCGSVWVIKDFGTRNWPYGLRE